MDPHPNKKQRLSGNDASLTGATADGDDQMMAASVGDLSTDVLANVFRFLGLKDIMRQRGVNKTWGEGVKKTVPPPTLFFWVDSIVRYNAMRVMTRAMPNLQQIYLEQIGHKYNDGEDPDEEEAVRTADYITHDIGIISNFTKLRELSIDEVPLNGRYPFLFNSFPLLQKLDLIHCIHLKWDLDMLAGLPALKELECNNGLCLTGNIRSLRVLKDTLEKVTIDRCRNVEGNFMDLADFPHLKKLDLDGTSVTGDMRDIGENDFSSLEQLILPKGVYGGRGSKFQRISDGPDLIRVVYLFNKKQHHPIMKLNWFLELSEHSPDWYDSVEDDEDTPPFYVTLVKAGTRIGYRWETDDGNPCEVNWLDPEPDRESSDYGKYIEELEEINSQVKFYKGFHQPPTEAEYQILLEEYDEEDEDDEEEEEYSYSAYDPFFGLG